MAQTVKAYAEPLKINLGGRTLAICEVTLGTEYKTEGIVLNAESLGLTDGLPDCAWCCNVVGPAKEATAMVGSITVQRAGGVEGANAPALKLQLYNLEPTTKKETEKELIILKEEAEKGAKGSEFKVVVCTIGR
jgi:hypothetical protein